MNIKFGSLVLYVVYLLKFATYISLIRKPWDFRVEKQATSPTIPGRPIGRTDGLDRASLGHFAKKPSDFTEINP